MPRRPDRSSPVAQAFGVAVRRVRRDQQAKFLAARTWDVVCPQEVTPGSLGPWREALEAQGLAHVRSSLDGWIPNEPPPEGRRLRVLTAARAALETIAAAHPPWPGRPLSVWVAAEATFELHDLHSQIFQKPAT